MGIPVDLISNIFNFIIAITIILSIKIVGVILIVALITIPALISLQIKTSFNNTVIISILIGLFGIILGIFISAIYKLSTSGIIVFTLVIIYAIVYIYSKIKIIKREKL
jgi:zinc transport system permease protein